MREVSSSSIEYRVIVLKWCIVQSPNMTLTFAHWPQNQQRYSSRHDQLICEVSSLHVKRKWNYGAETVQSLKSEFDLDIWPLDSKIHRSPPFGYVQYMYHLYIHFISKVSGVIVRKRCKLQSTNLTLTFGPQNQNGLFLRSWTIHVWSIIIVCQKEMELSCGNYFSTDRRTGGQTNSHGVISTCMPQQLRKRGA